MQISGWAMGQNVITKQNIQLELKRFIVDVTSLVWVTIKVGVLDFIQTVNEFHSKLKLIVKCQTPPYHENWSGKPNVQTAKARAHAIPTDEFKIKTYHDHYLIRPLIKTALIDAKISDCIEPLSMTVWTAQTPSVYVFIPVERTRMRTFNKCCCTWQFCYVTSYFTFRYRNWRVSRNKKMLFRLNGILQDIVSVQFQIHRSSTSNFSVDKACPDCTSKNLKSCSSKC